jgi:nucleoside-diphosphate-sugar epimerase
VSCADEKHIGPFNIGNPNEFTMLELANVVKEVVNPSTEIVFMENTSDDPSRRQVICSSSIEARPKTCLSYGGGLPHSYLCTNIVLFCACPSAGHFEG